MFSAFNYQGSNYGSPIRSDASPSRDRASVDPSRSMSPTNSVASGLSSCSAVSNGVKSRQIRDLKMEVELRDERVRELEEAYEELERKAAFTAGEVNCKLSDQQTLVRRMEDKHVELQQTINTQQIQMKEVMSSLQQYQSIQDMMQTMMQRCQELEAQKKEQDEKLRKVAEAEAERARNEEAAAAAAAASQAEIIAAAEKAAQEAEEKKRSEEEAAAKTAAAAAVAASAATIACAEPLAAASRQVVVVDPPAAPRGRFGGSRPNSAGAASQPRAGNKKDCSIM